MQAGSLRRLWLHGIIELIIGYLVLDLLVLVCQLWLRPPPYGFPPGKLIFWNGLGIFLLWRIWRGGRTSWAVLVVINSMAVAELIFGQKWPLGWYRTGLVVISSAQLLLLLCPTIRHHHPTPRTQ